MESLASLWTKLFLTILAIYFDFFCCPLSRVFRCILFFRTTCHNLNNPFHLHVFGVLAVSAFSYKWFFKLRWLLNNFGHFKQDNFSITGVQVTFINGLTDAYLKSAGLCPLIPQMWVEHGSDHSMIHIASNILEYSTGFRLDLTGFKRHLWNT